MAINETFTGSDGDELSAHTPDDGGSWTEHPALTAGAGRILSNQLRSASGSIGGYLHSWVPAGDEYDIEADFIPKTATATSDEMGIMFRADSVADTMYYFHRRHYNFGESWALFSYVAGSSTGLGSDSSAVVADQVYHVEVEVRTGNIRVVLDTVEILDIPDSTITAAGQVGVRHRGNNNATNGIRLDNLAADDAGGAAPQTMDGSPVSAATAVTTGAIAAAGALNGSPAPASTAATTGGLAAVAALAGSPASASTAGTTGAITRATRITLPPASLYVIAGGNIGVVVEGVTLSGAPAAASPAATSGSMVPGPRTLAGSPAASPAAATSGLLTSGAVALEGSPASAAAAAATGVLSVQGGPITLSGVSAPATAAAITGVLVPGAMQLAGTRAAAAPDATTGLLWSVSTLGGVAAAAAPAATAGTVIADQVLAGSPAAASGAARSGTMEGGEALSAHRDSTFVAAARSTTFIVRRSR